MKNTLLISFTLLLITLFSFTETKRKVNAILEIIPDSTTNIQLITDHPLKPKEYLIVNDSMSNEISEHGYYNEEIFCYKGDEIHYVLTLSKHRNGLLHKDESELRLLRFNKKGKLKGNTQALYLKDEISPMYCKVENGNFHIIYVKGMVLGIQNYTWHELIIDKKGNALSNKILSAKNSKLKIFNHPINIDRKVVIGFSEGINREVSISTTGTDISNYNTLILHDKFSAPGKHEIYYHDNKVWFLYEDNEYGKYLSIIKINGENPELIYHTKNISSIDLVTGFNNETGKINLWTDKWDPNYKSRFNYAPPQLTEEDSEYISFTQAEKNSSIENIILKKDSNYHDFGYFYNEYNGKDFNRCCE